MTMITIIMINIKSITFVYNYNNNYNNNRNTTTSSTNGKEIISDNDNCIYLHVDGTYATNIEKGYL